MAPRLATRELRGLAAGLMIRRSSADRVTFDALHAPGFVDRAAAGRPADRDGLWAGIVELRAGFPDFALTELEVIADGDRAAVRWAATGTHAGRFEGIAPTGRRIGFRGLELVRVVDGLVVERWGEWDDAGLRAQLAG
jgi:predicted ester cyclase